MALVTIIDSASLRVGNMIWNSYYNRAEELTLDGYVNIFNKASNSTTLKSIVLTPGWCESLGGVYGTDPVGKPSYTFSSKTGMMTIYFDTAVPVVMIDNFPVEIRFVHELQNLAYFVLGVDLKYSPPKTNK